MDEDKPIGRQILDGYRLYTETVYETPDTDIPFEPLIDEEYEGSCVHLDNYSEIWRPIIEIACESTFRGLLGGEKAGEGWFFSTKGKFKFNIEELKRPGVGAYISQFGSKDRDDWLWIEFFKEKFININHPLIQDEDVKLDILKFSLTTRAIIAEMFRMRLSEKTLLLAGRFGPPPNRRR